MVSQLISFLFQFLDSFAFIFLSAIGLAVIFGMMGVINLAHGEFIVIGAYGTSLTFHAGLPLPLAMLAGALATMVFGLLIERTIIRRLYGRLLDSMVATWGISLILVEGMRVVFGSSVRGIGTPFGSVQYGNYSYSSYRLFLAGVSIALLGALYYLFVYTDYGVYARATIQNEEMARSLGVDTERMYMVTFAIGSGLAGLTGALYAPTFALVPDMGAGFLVEAFVAVIVGGASPLVGTSMASGGLGFINALFSNLYGAFGGIIALLVTTIIVIRILPQGISGLILVNEDWEWQ